MIVFCNAGDPLYYISSADWMTRNLDHRIEVSAPIYDKDLQKEIQDCLDIQLSDNVKARIIDGKLLNKYKPRGENDQPINSHREIYNYFKKKLD